MEQTYLQSTTTRLEEMRVKRRDAEQWMSHRLLPDSLRERIRRHEQYKWQETRGVDEDSLIRDLPKDLRRDIKRHLCLALLMRVCFSISWVFFFTSCYYHSFTVTMIFVSFFYFWKWKFAWGIFVFGWWVLNRISNGTLNRKIWYTCT